jgi:stage II sporulation protein AA (anti-sigma F factor antagonist)
VEIKATRTDDVVVLEAAGMIDTRGSLQFEREIASHFDAGIRRFVIDLKRVDLITSAGIRVLVMLAKRVAGGGGLVLCGLNEHVTSVFDVAGLLQHFAITPSSAEGVVHVKRSARPAEATQKSKVSRAALRLLGQDVDLSGPAAPAGSRSPSRLAQEVSRLLSARADAPPSPASAGPAR